VLRRAIDAEKGALDLAFNLGFALLSEGQAEEAALFVRGTVEQDPTDLRAQVVLAWALRAAGREAEADGIWRKVVARSPSYESLGAPDLTRRFERVRDSEGPSVREGDAPVGQAAASSPNP
jgi:tetratricopeptide (TPR) repeat protein